MKNKELVNELWKLWEAMAEAGQLTINQNFSKRYDELKAQVEIYNGDIRESGEADCQHEWQQSEIGDWKFCLLCGVYIDPQSGLERT